MIDHPTTHTLHTLNLMTARGTPHQDLTTEPTATLPADSIHVTAPIRPTTIVTIRLHASVHPHINLTLARLALTNLHSLRRNVVAGTTPHPRETYAPTPPLIPNPIHLLLHPTHPQRFHPYLSPPLLHQPRSPIHRSLQANLPSLHHLSAQRKQLHDSPQPHIRILRRPSSAQNYPPPMSRR